MAERTVTVDRVSQHVPRPFLLDATQNPVEMDGTYTLAEAHLDRFMMRVSIGFPLAESEIKIPKSEHEGQPIDDLEPVILLEDPVNKCKTRTNKDAKFPSHDPST